MAARAIIGVLCAVVLAGSTTPGEPVTDPVRSKDSTLSTSTPTAEPTHSLRGLTLITTPRTVEAGHMMARVTGELRVNAKGCFALDNYVLVTAYAASILPSGDGIAVPGLGDVMIGGRMRGGGGYVERYKEPKAERCLTQSRPPPKA